MKNTTLRQLVVFEAVARHLHFTRAAEALGTTQPSVSMQIKQLEDNLGVALFEQIGRRVFLTEAGQELLHHCRKINRQLTEAEVALERLKGVQGGQLRIAIAPTAKYFMPRLLAEFVRLHPGVSIDLHLAGRDTLLAQLESNERDMVVMVSPPADASLVAEPFLHDPLVAIAPPDHPLVSQTNISPARLAQEPFLLREPGAETHHVFERFIEEEGLTFSNAMVVNSNEAIKHGVQAGLGIAIVPQQSIQLEQQTGRLAVLDVGAKSLQSTWHLVHRQEKRFSCVAEAFRGFLLREARNSLPVSSTGLGNPSNPEARGAEGRR
jgi:DNA-binding transcriptional LysR family regulator